MRPAVTPVHDASWIGGGGIHVVRRSPFDAARTTSSEQGAPGAFARRALAKPLAGAGSAVSPNAPSPRHTVANVFGVTVRTGGVERRTGVDVPDVVAETAVPADRARETLDVRELPPPKPLRNTLERLADLGDGTVLVQLNDRAPQHLYPRLGERGYAYETIETDAVVVTAIRDE